MPAALRLFEASCAWALEDDCLIGYDLSFTRGFRLGGADAATYSNGALDDLSRRLELALAHLPEGSVVRFYSVALTGYAEELASYLAAFPEGSVGAAVARDKVWQAERRVSPLRRELYAFVSTPPAREFTPHAPRLLWGRRGLRVRKRALRLHANKVRDAERIAVSLQRGLIACGIAVEPLGEAELFDVLWRFANPLDNARQRPIYRPELTLRSQLFAGGLQNYLDWFQRGASLQRVLSVRVPPLRIAPRGMHRHLQSLQMRHMLVTTLRRVSGRKAESRLERTRHTANQIQRVFRRFDLLPDIDANRQVDDAQDALERLKNGEKLFEVGVQVWLSSSSYDRLVRRTERVVDAFRSWEHAEASIEELRGRFAFLSMLPGHHTLMGKGRVHPMVSSLAADTLPVFGAWPGEQKAPTALLRTRDRELVGYHPFRFHPSLNANHVLMSGSTGSGKSFVLKVSFLGWVARGGRLIVVTCGTDYHRFAELFGGNIYDVSLDDRNLRLGPFPSKASYDAEDNPDALLEHLHSLIIIMVQERDRVLNRIERHFVQQSLTRLYERCEGTPDFGDWVEVVEQLGVEQAEHRELSRYLAAQMRFWIDGPYGHAFRTNREDLADERFCVWNLENIRDPETCGVVLALITETVRRSVAAGPTAFVQDEAWFVFKTAIGPEIAETYYRTGRKKGLVICAASQSVSDFAELPGAVSSAMLGNAHRKLLLKHSKDDLAVMSEILKLNETDQALAATVDFVPGAFSEMLFMYGDRRQVLVLEPSPLEYWIATSDTDDCEYEKALQSANPGKSRWEIVQMLANQKPCGVLNGEG